MSDEQHVNEHTRSLVVTRLSWLRAGVLGANDGLILTAGLVVGVAAASADIQDITTAGIAGIKEWIASFLRERGVSVKTASLVIEEFCDGEVLRALIRHGFGINEQ